MSIKLNKIYKAQYHIHDITDISVYVFEVLSERNVSYPRESVYYVARLVGTNNTFRFYPGEWSVVQELSSLEMELL